MKNLSNNLILMVLATVLSIAPLQAIAVSVSGCFDDAQTMHKSMSINHAGHQMVKSDKKQDCCETMSCDMTHCAGFVAIMVTPDTQNDLIYTLSDVFSNPTESLLPFYSSSLYRPPKG